jgi:hypothetical protein
MEENVLHNFNLDGKDGHSPGSLILDTAGNAYGTSGGGTGQGCTGGCGTVFELVHRNGKWTEKVLHSFNLDAGGYEPTPSLVLDKAGNLYGTNVLGAISPTALGVAAAPFSN